MSDVSLPQVIAALKIACTQADWWKYVQEEARGSLLFIIENVSTIGTLFREAFMSGFKYSHALRVVCGENVPFEEPSALLGSKFPEEFYKSGIMVAKSILKFDDWLEPNDADVYACMVLCQQIEALDRMGLLPDEIPHSATMLKDFFTSSVISPPTKP